MNNKLHANKKPNNKNVGKKILLMLGNEPLIAPRVLEKIRTPALQISLPEEQKRTRYREEQKHTNQ